MGFNVYRPVSVGYIGELAPKDKRVTILSVETQIKAILTFVFAPLFGYIADQAGIQVLFLIIGLMILTSNLKFRGDIRDPA